MGEEYLNSWVVYHNTLLMWILQYPWLEKRHHFSLGSFGHIGIMLTFIWKIYARLRIYNRYVPFLNDNANRYRQTNEFT